VCLRRAGVVRTLLQPARAQCLRLSERFFHSFMYSFIQLLLFNSPQIMIVPKDLKLNLSNSRLYGTEGRGWEWRKKGRVMSGFSLSRRVDPKHNPCTCRLMLRCCPAMAREQMLTESINLSTMELWNSLPELSPSRPVSWTIPLSAENAFVLTVCGT